MYTRINSSCVIDAFIGLEIDFRFSFFFFVGEKKKYFLNCIKWSIHVPSSFNILPIKYSLKLFSAQNIGQKVMHLSKNVLVNARELMCILLDFSLHISTALRWMINFCFKSEPKNRNQLFPFIDTKLSTDTHIPNTHMTIFFFRIFPIKN